MGYSLNQRGLFGGVVRDPKDRRIKLNKGEVFIMDSIAENNNSVGSLVASETEEEIFKILNVPWQEPHERVRG
jgi:DNA polymerase lambda